MIGDRSSASRDQLKALSDQLGKILDDGSLQQNEQGQVRSLLYWFTSGCDLGQ